MYFGKQSKVFFNFQKFQKTSGVPHGLPWLKIESSGPSFCAGGDIIHVYKLREMNGKNDMPLEDLESNI